MLRLIHVTVVSVIGNSQEEGSQSVPGYNPLRGFQVRGLSRSKAQVNVFDGGAAVVGLEIRTRLEGVPAAHPGEIPSPFIDVGHVGILDVAARPVIEARIIHVRVQRAALPEYRGKGGRKANLLPQVARYTQVGDEVRLSAVTPKTSRQHL